MTPYLVVCEHKKQILMRDNPEQALREFGCKRCVVFDLKNEQWRYKDIRIYRALQSDAAATMGEPLKRQRVSVDANQQDWVELAKG